MPEVTNEAEHPDPDLRMVGDCLREARRRLVANLRPGDEPLLNWDENGNLIDTSHEVPEYETAETRKAREDAAA